MSGAGYEREGPEERLRSAEHALLRAIPRKVLRAIWATQQIGPDPCGQVSARQAALHLIDHLSPVQDDPKHHPQRCLLCHDRLDAREGGTRAHFGLESGAGPRCVVFPAIIAIMRDCAAKRAEDKSERERWRANGH